MVVVSSSAAFSCKALEVVELLFLNKRRTICVIWLTQIWKPHKFPVHVLRSAVQRKHNQNKASRKQKASCVCLHCSSVSSYFITLRKRWNYSMHAVVLSHTYKGSRFLTYSSTAYELHSLSHFTLCSSKKNMWWLDSNTRWLVISLGSLFVILLLLLMKGSGNS